MENITAEAYQVIHLHKYLALKRRCEEIQLANEKLVNRIYNVKKILKRYKKERSALMSRLDELGDNYHDAFVPAMWAEGEQAEENNEHIAGLPDEETDQAVASISGSLEPKREMSQLVHEHLYGATSMASTSNSSTMNQGESKKGKKGKTASPYMLFCSHRKATIQQEYLEQTGEEPSRAELTKLLSQEWAQVSYEEKQVYLDIAEKKKHENDNPPQVVKQETVKSEISADTTDYVQQPSSLPAISLIKKE